MFAHNGTFGGLDIVDARLTELGVADLVLGQTDSERMFALITAHARSNGGDVGAAIAAAVSWIADHLPVFALNLIVATPDELWALRYPATHGLYVLDRTHSPEPLEVRTARIHAKSDDLRDAPALVDRQRTNGRRNRLAQAGSRRAGARRRRLERRSQPTAAGALPRTR